MTRGFGMTFDKRFSFPINHVEIFRDKSIDVEWFSKHAAVINEVYIDPGFLEIETKDTFQQLLELRYQTEQLLLMRNNS